MPHDPVCNLYYNFINNLKKANTVNPRMLSHGVTQKWKTSAVCSSAILRTRSLNFFPAVQLLVSYI
jgi:hypothetical protein